MAPKRTSQERDQGSDDRDLQVAGKRRHGNPDQAGTRHHSFLTAIRSNAMNDIALFLEPVVRKVAREEIATALQRHRTPCCGLNLIQEASTSGGRPLQLCFTHKLPQKIFTQSIIKAEGGVALQIELRDNASQRRVVRDEYSSMKILLCVQHGDFGSKGKEDWTAEEFNAQTVSPRDGKGPLLNGETVITLKNGVGYISKKIVFTDNSSWTRSKKFRLGVKIVQSNSIGADIREGISEPFKVKDHRGEAYKKHDPPSLTDEVWRLKKIAKDGTRHKQLSSHGIKTVKDLLQLHITNQASLRKKMGNIAGESWNKIIQHAKRCDIDDDKRYIYYATEQSISLVFNCIYEVVEVTLNGQCSRSIQSLNLEEKHLVERVKQQAYNNLKDLMPLDTTTHGLVNASIGVQTAQGLPQFDFPIAQQGPLNAYPTSFNLSSAGQPETWPSTSASQSGLVGSDQLPALGEMHPNWSVGGQFISGAYTDYGVSQIDPFATSLIPPNQWELLNAYPFSFVYNDGAESSNHPFLPNSDVHISSKGKRKTVWYKIRAALRWVRLHVARKKA